MTFRWRPRSIRMRLTFWYGGALALALLAYALFVCFFLWRMLSADLDRQLARDVEVSEQVLDPQDGRLIWDEEGQIDDREMPCIEVFAQDGRLLFRSSTYKHVRPSAYRIISRIGRVEGLPPVTIHAARPLAPMYRELRFLVVILCLGIPLVVVMAAVGGYLLSRRALAPVDRMAGLAQKITANQLSERLPVVNSDDELGRLAMVFNEMFARLEHAFDQMRRFTADASHEMRTPLTIIRSVGEVGLEERHGEGKYREIIGSMLEEVDRLTRLVDSLLTLSRADSGQLRLHQERINLSSLAEEVVQRLNVLAEEKGQSIRLEAPAELMVCCDQMVLRLALTNLVDNAIKYSPEQTEIRIVAHQAASGTEVSVIDHGPGIAAEHRRLIFDRFYRVDKARSRQMGGTGLGLSIARWAVEANGGVIELESAAGGGSLFRITLPNGKGAADKLERVRV